jgi:integrase
MCTTVVQLFLAGQKESAMTTVRMTDRFVAAAKVGEAIRLGEFYDEVTSGLVLRVTRGAKSWSFFYTAPATSKRARVGLGHYPQTSLAAARARAIEAAELVENGEDPRATFAARVRGAATIADLVQSYLALHVRARKRRRGSKIERELRSASKIERRLRKNVLPVIGDVRLADLHRRNITRVTDALLRRGSPSEANHVFWDLRTMFRWAVKRGDLDHSPTSDMDKPGDVVTRDRVLTDDEIRALWNGLPEWLVGSRTCTRTTCARILRLCLVTGQRLGEVAGMRRAELDLERRLWRLPPERVKNNTAHSVPLSDLALTLIGEALDAAGEDSELVFTGRDGKAISPIFVAGVILGSRKPTKAYPAGRCPVKDWSVHDLRRTALTGMARLGVAPIVLGHIANHRTTTRAGVTLAVYSQYSYDKEKRVALDVWAERLAAIVATSRSARVVHLGRGRA